MSDRLNTARNVAYFARHGHWHSALLRLRCVVMGHSYNALGITQQCSRCQWVRAKPNPTKADYMATRLSLAAREREESSTHSERTA